MTFHRSVRSTVLAAATTFALASYAGCGDGNVGDLSSLNQGSSSDTVSATNVAIAISGSQAVGSYSFSSSAGHSDSGSKYAILRADSASGENATTVGTSKTWSLSTSDNTKYLAFCVTPADGTATGAQVCSSYSSVGHLLELYKDSSYGGTNINLAYEVAGSGTCFNMPSYSFNDELSSYKLHTVSSGNVSMVFYKDASCSGSIQSSVAGPNYTVTASSMLSGWNDAVSSVRLVWNDSVSIANVSLTISGASAQPVYSFSSSSSLPDSSVYTWFRASDSAGTSQTALGTTATSKILVPDDNNMYLRVCVTPSDGFALGYGSCSDYSWVGHTIDLYEDDKAGGDSISIAYELSTANTCFNLTDYNFNDEVSSYKINTRSSGGANVLTYAKINCSNWIDEMSFDANKSGYWSQSWGLHDNDVMSSIKVDW